MKKIISFLLATVMLLGMFSIGAFAENSLDLDIKAVEGASVRIGEVAGIRFQTMINKAELDAIVEKNGASNVEIGTLITPTQYVKGAGAFTMEALDAYKAVKGFENAAYVKVKATYAKPFGTETVDGTEYYVYAGSLENILDANVMLDFSGIGYVKVGDEIVYAEYNEFNSSRTVGYVAYRAYLDKDSGLDSDDKTLIDNFANKFLVSARGSGAPDIANVFYYENFNDYENSFENNVMDLNTVSGISEELMADLGITCVSDGGLVNYMWIDSGRLLISNFSGYEGDTRVKDTSGKYSFFKIDALDDAAKMASLYGDKFTIQYDVAYGNKDVVPGSGGLEQDIASWASMLDIILNMDGANGVACGVSAGGFLRFDYLSTNAEGVTTDKLLIDESLFARGKVFGNKLRENDVGAITVRIDVDPETNAVQVYAKLPTHNVFTLIATASTTSDGYSDLVNATSKSIGLALQYGTNAFLDNLIVYRGVSVKNGADGGKVYYSEDFDFANSFENNIMDVNTVNDISAQLMQELGITCVSDGGMTNYMWIDNGRLMISSFSNFTGDTRAKNTTGEYSFFKIDALDDAVKMAELYGDTFTVQYDLTYGFADVDSAKSGNERDTATWNSMFDVILNMDGANGTACGVGVGGFARLDYLTTVDGVTTNAVLTDDSLYVRGKALDVDLREHRGGITVRIVVDPDTNLIKMYAKKDNMIDFFFVGATSVASEGYESLASATSQSIGFALQYGNNVLLDNLIVYSGDGGYLQ